MTSSGNATCFGTDLGYNSVYLTDKTYWEIQSQLHNLSVLRYAPKCWGKIQPLLCAYYLPECSVKNTNNNTFRSIDMIPKNICFEAREKCGIINFLSNYNVSNYTLSNTTKARENGWPEFLDCDNPNLFYENQQFLQQFLEKHKNDVKEKDNNILCQTVEHLKDTTLERTDL